MPRLPPFNPGFKLSVGIPLLATTALAWYLSAYALPTSSLVTMESSMSSVRLAMMSAMFTSPDAEMLSIFLLVWLVGMVAMMFPAMIPVMSFYSRMATAEKRQFSSAHFVKLVLFLCGYLLLYALLGLGLFAAVYAAFQLSAILPLLSSLSMAGMVAVLLGTGVWQLTPLKEKSLSKCVSPIGFFLTHFKKGLSGAFKMGAEHGVYCVGCCWLYMVVMLAVAAMSLPSMVLLSGLIIIEKAFIGRSPLFKWVSAGIFFSFAGVVVAYPSYLAFF